MRFRIITNHPLPLVRSWFLVADNVQQRRQTIQDLKNDLCTKFDELASLRGGAFKLSIDDFDLLDGESIDIIKENDLVCITKLDNPIAKKRRASALSESSEEERLSTKRRRKSVHFPDVSLKSQSPSRKYVSNKLSFSDSFSESSSEDSSSEDSSSEDSSTEDSSSEDSSSEDSSTEDSSTEDSSTDDSESDLDSSDPSSSSVSNESTSTAKDIGAADNLKRKQTPLVPPGEGKLSTHSRNARRKLKRLYERQKKFAEQNGLKVIAENSANNVPLGERQLRSAAEDLADKDQTKEPGSSGTLDGIEDGIGVGSVEVDDLSQSMPLRNKNKKNGFKRSMNGKVSQKIVFDDNGVEINGSGVNGGASPAKPRARLITPSEKQARGEIPDNIFVTSVELELDDNALDKWESKKKKKKGRDNWGYGENGEEKGNSGYGTSLGNEEVGDVVLDYGEEDLGKRGIGLDLKKIEKGWDTYGEIKDASVLKEEDLVAWKSLAINPSTCTPEWMIGIGRVMSVNREETKLTVKILQQAGMDQFSFGNGGITDDDVEMQSETEEWSFEDIRSWRIVLGSPTG